VDRLPLTPNGKIDRQALPAPRSQSVDEEPAQSTDDRPRREMERILVGIWAEALGVAQVGMDENIFDLGASSLMMPEVQMELQRRLGREVSLSDLFEFHTVKTLAAHLTGHAVAVPTSDRGQRRRAARMQEGLP
jgi:acyl carrier protein